MTGKNNSRTHCFTLVEMMVYIGVSFVIIAVMYSAFGNGKKHLRAITHTALATTRVTNAGDAWRRAVQQAVYIDSNSPENMIMSNAEGRRIAFYFSGGKLWVTHSDTNRHHAVMNGIKTLRFHRIAVHGVDAWQMRCVTADNLSGVVPGLEFRFTGIPGFRINER